MENDLKTKLHAWKKRLGYSEASRRMVIAGINVSAAQKLLAGTYPSNPKIDMLKLIDKAMEAK